MIGAIQNKIKSIEPGNFAYKMILISSSRTLAGKGSTIWLIPFGSEGFR